jgi:hypothetical protein
MNSIIARALAALGNDGGGDNGTSTNTREGQQQQRQQLDADVTLPNAETQFTIRSLPVLHYGGGSSDAIDAVETATNTTRNSDAEGKKSSIGGPGMSERLNVNDISINNLNRLPILHHGSDSRGETDIVVTATSTRSSAHFDLDGGGYRESSVGDSSKREREEGTKFTVGAEENATEPDEIIVRPHNRDILQCFLSTPFDGSEMLSLHRLKEGIEPVGRKRRRSMAMDQLPISPQKHFIKKKKGDETGCNSSVSMPVTLNSADSERRKEQASDPTSITHRVDQDNCLVPPQQPACSEVASMLMPPAQQQQQQPYQQPRTVHLSIQPPDNSSQQPAPVGLSSQQQRQINHQPPADHTTIRQPDNNCLNLHQPAWVGLSLHPSTQQQSHQFQFSRITTPHQPAWSGVLPQPSTQHQPFQPYPRLPIMQQMLPQYYHQGHLLNACGWNQQQNTYPTHLVHASNLPHYPQHLAVSAPVLGASMQTIGRDHNQAPASAKMPMPRSMLESRSPSSSQAAIADTGRSKPPTDPFVVVAGKAVKLDNSNRDQIAKLPVAFGYSLADSGVSKALALAATQNWYESGKLAAAVEFNSKGSRKGVKGPPTDVINGKGNHDTIKNIDSCGGTKPATPESGRGDAKDKRRIRKQQKQERLKAKKQRRMEKSERKRRREENNPSSSNCTPKSTSGTSPDCKIERKRKEEEKNPSSSNSTPESASGTSPVCKSVKKGKSGNKPSIIKPKSSGASPSGSGAATLIASSDSPPGLPTGWKMKTFRRMAGKTAGTTDSYWFSPQLMHRFRSMKGCNLFIGILNEPGIDGNESVAINEFKKRGFRV